MVTVPPIRRLPRPSTEIGILLAGRAFGGQERFLGVAAGVPQGDRLPGIELGPLFGEAGGDEVGQGQVHVVAADQEVISHGHAAEDQFAAFLGHGHQREVGRAAAHVADQQRIAQLQGPPPAVAAIGQPGIDGRLRLFQQDEIVGQPGRQGRLAGQLAGAGVERGRHGQDHELLGHGGFRMQFLPGRDHVFEVALRGRDRRNLGHALRRAPGQDRLMAIDPAIGQPRLGRADGPVGHFGPLPPGIFAHGKVALLGPRQIERPAARFVGVGQIGERRQHGPRLDRPAAHQLRQGQEFDLRILGVQRRIGQHAVGRAQIEPQDEFRRVLLHARTHANSTSTGATTRAESCVPDQAGNWTSAASQPWCTRRP